jgi:hypothetical protein
MSRHPIRPEDVERALDGSGPWPPGLARLVTAAQAAPGPGELAGEEAAVTAFHRARTEPAPVRRTLARVLAVKVAAGVAVLAVGGYAVAAASGAVPAPPFVPERVPAPVQTTPANNPGGNRTAAPQQPTPATGPGTPHRPATSYAGLCRGYLNGPAGRDTPPMRDLVAAAGGADRVAAFCAAIGVPAPSAPPAAGPDQKPPHSKDPKPPRPSKPAKPSKPPKPPAGQPAKDAT